MNATGVFTNKVATDAYRGAGRPEATYILERMMDIAAVELGMDPVEIRRKNFPDKSEFPFNTSAGLSYDSGDYHLALDRALEAADYPAMRAEQEEARKDGRYLGIGFSTYVEICGMGPSAALGGQGWESARVRVEPTGKATVFSGASPHGQGQQTSFAQIVADGLGIDANDVTVVHGDTDVVPYGVGTFGSRGTVVGGSAVVYARDKVRAKMAKFAAMEFEADTNDIEFEDGKVFVRSAPEKSAGFADIAMMAYSAIALPEDTEPGLEETHFFEPSNFTFPFGTHIVLTEVDPETGDVEILRYVAVDDVGNMINPLLVHGQIHGGIAQGTGQALGGRDALRRGRPAAERIVHALRFAQGEPSAAFRASAHHHADGREPAGCEGRGRGRHHRLHARRGERRDRRAFAIRYHAHRHAAAPRESVARHRRGRGPEK